MKALSVARWFDPVISVGLATSIFLLLYQTGISDVQLTLFIVVVTSGYLFISELSRARWKFEDRPKQSFAEVTDRTITKFSGVLLGIIFIFFCVWLFPAYNNEANLVHLREGASLALFFIIPAAFLLIFATEYILGEKRDGSYQFGLLARFKWRAINWTIFFDGVREWLLRMFFLLINYYAALSYVANIRTKGLPDPLGDFPTFITQLDLAIFGLIIFAILPGYVFASRLINTEVKKVDRTWFGWAINFCCYPPLNAAVFAGWVAYRPSLEMREIFGNLPAWAYYTLTHEVILYTVGALIIFFAILHLWGEAVVGIRAANMSSRGIITTNLFRLTKHPIYVSKCFQWALIFFPVLNAIGFLNALQSGILFLLVCAIYVGRALSEERLLATDPNYVKYALYMDKKSIFAFIGRWFPVMSFRWRLEYWQKKGLLQY